MKPKSSKFIGLSGILAITLFGVSPAFAVKWNECASINLRDGSYDFSPNTFISFEVLPQDTNGDGYYETVLKISFNYPQSPNAAKFSITYDGIPMGNSVNIGDSSTNDGGGGDSATQSNDAELQIGRQADTSGGLDPSPDLWVYGHDGYSNVTGTQVVSEIPGFVAQGDAVLIETSNGGVDFDNAEIPLSGGLTSPYLYALNGQQDSEGPVNYDIYAAFNRVINTNGSRLGSGVGLVDICLLPKR